MLFTAVVALSHLLIRLVPMLTFFFLSSIAVSRSSCACKRVNTCIVLGLRLALNLLITCPAALKSHSLLADVACTASNHHVTLLSTGSCLLWACRHSRMGVFTDLIRRLNTSHSSLLYGWCTKLKHSQCKVLTQTLCNYTAPIVR